MENYKYIDISKLPEEAFGNIKNIIALDSQNEVIKAQKQDTYTKEEIDELLSNTEVSADNLKDKIKINSATTDYVVTQPTVSGNSLIITDAMSDKNQLHTFGFDKTTNGTVPITNYINITRGYNAVPEMETDIEDYIEFEVHSDVSDVYANMGGEVPLELDKFDELTNILHYVVSYSERDSENNVIGGDEQVIADVTYNPSTQLLSVPDGGFSFAQIRRTDTNTYLFGGGTDGTEYLENGRWYYNFAQNPLQEGASLIWMPYYNSNLYWDYSVTIEGIFWGEGEVTTDNKPYLLNDYIRYKDEKAYILTDMNYQNVIKNKDVQINSATTDYVVTQPIVSGDNIVITDVVSDKNQFHTLGFDKTFSKEDWVYRTDFIFEEGGKKIYSCPDWNASDNTLTMSVNSESYGQFRFTYYYFDTNGAPTKGAMLDITISEGSITLAKNAEYPTTSSSFVSYYNNILKVSVDGTNISYFPNAFSVGSVSKTFGDDSKIVFTLGKMGSPGVQIPPQIKTTGEQNILQAPETVTAQTSDYPERLNDYIRYSNDEKAYILTDKNYQNVIKEWVGTQEEYDALETIDNNTTYYITE